MSELASSGFHKDVNIHHCTIRDWLPAIYASFSTSDKFSFEKKVFFF